MMELLAVGAGVGSLIALALLAVAATGVSTTAASATALTETAVRTAFLSPIQMVGPIVGEETSSSHPAD
ncbi:hypothetical protein GCM10009733_074650 [Nonomuraea maheshkhaliensis]|uniref:Secreted protein n=1 Tax=Nonomuraea maheshkhaliensis TaxID=419590 RepID=A0ABP4S1V9_9ACTN